MHKTIRRIASDLLIPRYIAYDGPTEDKQISHQGLVYFAALAKAEMAKRGWEYEMCLDDGMMGIAFGKPGTGHAWAVQVPDVGYFNFDQRDPNSEAEAILNACAEALAL